MADLKCVYKAATLNAAETALDELEGKWGEKYPLVIRTLRGNYSPPSAKITKKTLDRIFASKNSFSHVGIKPSWSGA